MEVVLKKQPEKYMDKCTQNDYDKIDDALDGLQNLDGDIVKLSGRKNEYRLKIPPFRIIFQIIDVADDTDSTKTKKVIVVTRINTRGDVYKKG